MRTSQHTTRVQPPKQGTCKKPVSNYLLAHFVIAARSSCLVLRSLERLQGEFLKELWPVDAFDFHIFMRSDNLGYHGNKNSVLFEYSCLVMILSHLCTYTGYCLPNLFENKFYFMLINFHVSFSLDSI